MAASPKTAKIEAVAPVVVEAPAPVAAPAPVVFEATVEKLKEGVEAATKAHSDFSAKAVKAVNDMVAFNKASVEALTAAGKIFAAGSVDLAKDVAASNKAAYEETVAGLKALAAVKSVKEGFELQSSLARASAERAVAESTRLVKASFALAEQVSAPLTAQASKAAEAFAALKA